MPNQDELHGAGRHDQRQPQQHHHQVRRYEEQPPYASHDQQQQQPYARHDRRYYQSPRGHRAHRSGALQWAVAVVFTVLAIAVLVAAVAVLIVVLLLQPRSPYVAVRSAQLNTLVYDQQGTLDDVQLSLVVEARNGNAHSGAAFSDLEVRLAFAGTVLARLRADPFGVPAKGALPLAYVARARGAPLGGAGGAAMEAALRDGVVPFGVDGEARARWRLAGLIGVRHWTRLACELRFSWPNGTAQAFSCSSKSKPWFF